MCSPDANLWRSGSSASSLSSSWPILCLGGCCCKEDVGRSKSQQTVDRPYHASAATWNGWNPHRQVRKTPPPHHKRPKSAAQRASQAGPSAGRKPSRPEMGEHVSITRSAEILIGIDSHLSLPEPGQSKVTGPSSSCAVSLAFS